MRKIANFLRYVANRFDPKKPVEPLDLLIVFPTQELALRSAARSEKSERIAYAWEGAPVQSFLRSPPRQIIIHPDVNLSADVHGQGQLEPILRSRQATYGSARSFIKL